MSEPNGVTRPTETHSKKWYGYSMLRIALAATVTGCSPENGSIETRDDPAIVLNRMEDIAKYDAQTDIVADATFLPNGAIAIVAGDSLRIYKDGEADYSAIQLPADTSFGRVHWRISSDGQSILAVNRMSSRLFSWAGSWKSQSVGQDSVELVDISYHGSLGVLLVGHLVDGSVAVGIQSPSTAQPTWVRVPNLSRVPWLPGAAISTDGTSTILSIAKPKALYEISGPELHASYIEAFGGLTSRLLPPDVTEADMRRNLVRTGALAGAHPIGPYIVAVHVPRAGSRELLLYERESERIVARTLLAATMNILDVRSATCEALVVAVEDGRELITRYHVQYMESAARRNFEGESRSHQCTNFQEEARWRCSHALQFYSLRWS